MIVEDTYAEAFRGYYSEVVVTARDRKWLDYALNSVVGNATSTIACDCEAGVDVYLGGKDTPDGRVGARVQFWVPAWRKDAIRQLELAVIHRIGNNILTCPSTRVFNSSLNENKFPVGKKVGFFGDKYQKQETHFGRKMIVIPTMMGEFLIEEELGYGEGVMGGNLWFMGDSEDSALSAAGRVVEVVKSIDGVITTFPGGVCASGSKAGSRYDFLVASTNHLYCPTLAGVVEDCGIPEGVKSVSEVVMNGVSLEKVKYAMHAGIQAARDTPGLVRISAGNYGGRLGKYNIKLIE